MYKVLLAKQALKDLEHLKRAKLGKKAAAIALILVHSPYKPPCEKLSRDLIGYYSKRINDMHRMVYEVLPNLENLQMTKEINTKGS